MMPVRIPVGESNIVRWKSKKSFYSDVAITAEKTKVTTDINSYLDKGETPIFELVSPDHRIVLPYEETKLHYLMSRNIHTGEYNIGSRDSDPAVIKMIAHERISDIYQFIDHVRKLTGIEGYVLWDGKDFYKIKTEWYLERHHAISSMSVRDLIDLIVEDKIDDVIATLNLYSLTRNIELITKYCDEVAHATRTWDVYVNSIYVYCKHEFGDDRKASAEYLYKTNKQIAPLVFNILSGKDYYTPMRRMIGDLMKEKYKGHVIFMGQEKGI